MMANAAGPIMVIYLLAMRLPKTEFIGTAVWIHYINRIAAVFLDPRLIRIPEGLGALRATAERMGGRYFAGTVARRLEPGAALAQGFDRAALEWAAKRAAPWRLAAVAGPDGPQP